MQPCFRSVIPRYIIQKYDTQEQTFNNKQLWMGIHHAYESIGKLL